MKTKLFQPGPARAVIQSAIALFKLVLIGFFCVAALIQPVQSASVRWLTIVSLTFDDGLTQSLAGDILAAHGMQGTFYVNSDLIDSGGSYLTKAELDALFADGNEIGGHTNGHVNLALLSDAEQKAAICNDMQTLVNWGYDIHSFAYPYSSTGPTTEGIVAAGCPGVGTYESARAVGGLVTGTECFNCPWAETLPPANPYYITTNASVASTTTLEDLKSYVMQAETNGGGWVPLVFHRVCDGCSSLAVSPSVLDAFLIWLEARESQDTYVRTVHQVMSGDYPAPPPPPDLGPNLVINPSLENDVNSDNLADCWERDSYGTNNASFSRINSSATAHTGNFSEKLTITSYGSGDGKLLQMLDVGQVAGGCAPSVDAGEIYQFSLWYKATATPTLVLFYLDANGIWQYWRDGPQVEASSSWQQLVYYPGALPEGAQALSFGLALDRSGTLYTDDYSLAQVLDGPSPPDTTPPQILGFSPVNGATITGTVSLSASASDNVALQRVEFLINGNVVATDTINPYNQLWDSKTVANGTGSYSVRAYDFAGNEASSEVRTLTFANDLSAPVVSFNHPPTPNNGDTVSGQVQFAVTATDDTGVSRVDFLVNGSVVGSTNVVPYSITWNSLTVPDGAASLTAAAYDASGNSTATNAVNVTVSNNSGNLLTNPSLEIDANNNGVADCWQRAGYGTNTYTWTRLGPGQGHGSDYAESLQVTSRTSGDRKLIQLLDAGTCAPAVTAGARYALSSWYKSTVSTGFVVYYRTTAGVWKYWQTSANFAAAGDWAQASYTTPPLPSDATALSFGMYLNQPGTLVTDGYAMSSAP